MEFKMIISRALFTFKGIEKGRAKLQSVRFLSDEMMEEQNSVLMIKGSTRVDFFINGNALLTKMSHEQFKYLAAASRFFGHLPGSSGKIAMWVCTASLQSPLPKHWGVPDMPVFKAA
ncbi:hypothetical protein [Desulfogranum japonicum]|uniref:hypothetical protein n=1 Tax=Desulfogranum japonicum TaxID=231447 RepID=UPI0003F6C020|nr:hypothetical protein [Desulfogranum japonicum]